MALRLFSRAHIEDYARQCIAVTLHVVHGDAGFERAMTLRRSKLARVLNHEFARVERAGRGFVRIERHGASEHEMHFEYAPRYGGDSARWITR